MFDRVLNMLPNIHAFFYKQHFYTQHQQHKAHCVKSVRVFSGPYFPVFSPNAEKYEPEKTPYLDAFHAVAKIGKKLSKC